MAHILDYYLNPERKILGEDKWMVDNRKYNYFSQCMHFEREIPDIDAHLRRVVSKWFSDPRSVFRAYVPPGRRTFYYDQGSSRTLCERFLHRVEAINIDDVERYAIRQHATAVLFYTDRALCLCCQHLFFDGVKAYNLIQDVFDNDHRFAIDPFLYVPLLHELRLFAGCGAYTFPTQRYLTYDVDYTRSRAYRPLRLRHHLAAYKKVKARCTTKVAFASVVISKMLRHLFRVTGVAFISFGVLVGMNSNCRFNNYGVVVCEVSRPDEGEGPAAYAMRVHKTIDKRKEMAMASFVGSNIYGMDMMYGEIDVLFSGMPMTLDKPITVNGSRLKQVDSNMRHTSMPIYCGYLSCDRYVNLYLNIRTNMVDEAALARSLGRAEDSTKVARNNARLT